jgi:two-component system, LuxR family, response regulator FixJ
MSAADSPSGDFGSQEPIVWVVDDDKRVLHAIGFLLESVGLRSSTHSSAEEFLEAYDPGRPGCIILDIRMPGTSGVTLQQQLLERGAKHPIIFLTAHADVPTTVEIMRAGAVDLIQKPFREQQLIDRVSSILKENVRAMEGSALRGEVKERLARLTAREHQVMRLVVEGRSSKGIAAELRISQRTVDVHRARMMKKLEVNSATKLVRLVMGEKG